MPTRSPSNALLMSICVFINHSRLQWWTENNFDYFLQFINTVNGRLAGALPIRFPKDRMLSSVLGRSDCTCSNATRVPDR